MKSISKQNLKIMHKNLFKAVSIIQGLYPRKATKKFKQLSSLNGTQQMCKAQKTEVVKFQFTLLLIIFCFSGV